MSPMQVFVIAIALLLLVGVPAVMIWSIWAYLSGKGSERPSHTSSAGACLSVLDQVVRPSMVHQIVEENRVVKDEAGVDGE